MILYLLGCMAMWPRPEAPKAEPETPSVSSPTDDDGDGYLATTEDCDDSNAAVHPGASELCNNLDDNCDGTTDNNAADARTWYADVDRDGYGDDAATQSACTAPADHTATAGDCDDTAATIHPDAEESSNTLDDNCDRTVDEGCVELCVHIDSASGYSCADWAANNLGIAGQSCDLDYAEDGQLWVGSEGWNTDPVAEVAGSFTEICAMVPASPGDSLKVNGHFYNTRAEVPLNYDGEWWWCANWGNVGARSGTFTIDGVVATTTVVDQHTGAFDCYVQVP